MVYRLLLLGDWLYRDDKYVIFVDILLKMDVLSSANYKRNKNNVGVI